jgi:hypothetical protein
MIGERYGAEFAERAVRGMNAEFKQAPPIAGLARLLTEQETAAYRGDRKLGAKALRRQASFEHDRVVLAEHVASCSKALRSRWLPVHERPPAALAESRLGLNVFGPDTGEPGGPTPYSLTWTQIDGGTGGVDIGATANVHDGTFSASHSTHGWNQFSAYAGLGGSYIPALKVSKLTISPWLNWHGFDVLSTRVFDPGPDPHSWGTAGAQVGLYLQSWDLAGNDFRTDTSKWAILWNRVEMNPSGMLTYDGSVGASDLQLTWLVNNQRQYAIWVVCRALVITQAIFDLDISSTASVSCQLPFFFVEEDPWP